MRTVVIRRAIVAGLFVAGTGYGAVAGDAQAAAEVGIDNFTFSPAVLTVAPGTTVTWTNHDDIPHTVTSSDDPAAMRSPVLDTGDAYRFTFTTPGSYGFFCSLHPHMQSKVIVR